MAQQDGVTTSQPSSRAGNRSVAVSLRVGPGRMPAGPYPADPPKLRDGAWPVFASPARHRCWRGPTSRGRSGSGPGCSRRWIPSPVHGSILSTVGASRKPGAVQCGPAPLAKYSCAVLPLAVASGRDLSHRGRMLEFGGGSSAIGSKPWLMASVIVSPRLTSAGDALPTAGPHAMPWSAGPRTRHHCGHA